MTSPPAIAPAGDKANLEVATAQNNLGFLLKHRGFLVEARAHYDAAVGTRLALLGPAHPDTVVARSNLAELLIASGQPEEGAALQQAILDALHVVDADGDHADGPLADDSASKGH